jgi:hypothetical protein
MFSGEIELDNRQRLPLAKVPHGAVSRFRVTELPGGELLLSPVVSLSQREFEMLSNPARVASIQEGIAQAREGKVTVFPAGHFAKLAVDLGVDPFDDEV